MPSAMGGGRPTSKLAQRAWVGLLVVTLVAIVAIVASAPHDLFELAASGSEARIRQMVGGWSQAEVADARRSLDWGYGVIVLVVGLLASACFWRAGWEPAGRERRGWWRAPTAFAALAGVAGACAIAEHALLQRTITSFRRGADLPDARLLLALSLTKCVAAAFVIGYLVSLLPQRLPAPAGGAAFGLSTARPAFLREPGRPHPWEPPLDEHRLGISCSGGGVRSASFCLGALQTLRRTGELARASYVTAASGGSYIAAGYAAAATAYPADADTPVDDHAGGAAATPAEGATAAFDPGSPEERWLRANSSYLAPDRRTLVAGVARLLGGLGVNLVLIWLLLFTVSRPVGWLISSSAIHPELRAREPIIEVDRAPQVDAIQLQPIAGAATDRDGPRFTMRVAWKDALVQLDGRNVESRQARLPVIVARDGTIGFDDGRLRVLQQPRIDVDNEPIGPTFNAVAGSQGVRVDAQPSFQLAGVNGVTLDSRLDPDQLETQVELSHPPRLRQASGTTGRPPIDIEPWMVAGTVVPAIVALLLYGAKLLRRDERWPFDWLIGLAAAVSATVFALCIALPMAVQELPTALSDLFGTVPGVDDATGSSGRALVEAIPPVVAFLAMSWAAIRTSLQRGRKERAAVRRLARGLVAVLLPLVGFLLFVDLLELSTANGPFGHLAGFGLGWQPFPDWARFTFVVAVLVVGWRVADAHAWSMYPFYKQRLQSAFVLRRRHHGQAAGPVEYERPIWLTDNDRLARPGPQLVVCAAANLSETGRTPPGRRAVSFTFSGSEVGGPQVGYVPTAALQAATSEGRQRDLTLVSAMAISGAAVSPAMGKMSPGAFGRVFAVLNVRLGVWLPHPEWVSRFIELERSPAAVRGSSGVAEAETALPRWSDRPGWPYLFREVLGRFRFANRYLYVSDGGHWENLGLVELLRRGCTEVVCISAAGDGPSSFGTIAEAIALAREELGVEVEIELSPLRALVGTLGDSGGAVKRRVVRQLLTGGQSPAARPYADKPYAVGTIRYPASARHDGRPVTGRLVVIEANLTASLPWDVQAFAEGTPRFPDESTSDQFFDHRQFEAYRRLGEFQMDTALASVEWALATVPHPGPGRAGPSAPAAVDVGPVASAAGGGGGDTAAGVEPGAPVGPAASPAEARAGGRPHVDPPYVDPPGVDVQGVDPPHVDPPGVDEHDVAGPAPGDRGADDLRTPDDQPADDAALDGPDDDAAVDGRGDDAALDGPDDDAAVDGPDGGAPASSRRPDPSSEGAGGPQDADATDAGGGPAARPPATPGRTNGRGTRPDARPSRRAKVAVDADADTGPGVEADAGGEETVDGGGERDVDADADTGGEVDARGERTVDAGGGPGVGAEGEGAGAASSEGDVDAGGEGTIDAGGERDVDAGGSDAGAPPAQRRTARQARARRGRGQST